MQVLAFLLSRLSEPSSYAGLGAVLVAFGFQFSDSEVGQIAQFLAAGCGLAAVFLKERGLISMIALAVLAGTALGACSSLPSAATIQSDAQVVLTATEQAMCAAQSAANLAGAVAAAAGDATAAADASKASAAAGVGCTWSTPVPAATSTAASS